MTIKTISINAKCSDLCFTRLNDEAGNAVAEKDGYVPDFMPGKHYGDYIQLEIDVETGRILNWSPPTQEDMLEGIEKV